MARWAKSKPRSEPFFAPGRDFGRQATMKNPKNSDDRQYDLKSKAVDDLVEAHSGDAPQYSREELNRYRSHSGIRIPQAVKILFIKAWFSGAVCFFFLWGLGSYLGTVLDQLFVLGFALGIVTDLLVNNAIRFIEKEPGENNGWMMFPKKGTASLFLNILYFFLVLFCVYSLYNLINMAAAAVTGKPDQVWLGVEPILFGLFCLGFDMLFIGIKHLAGKILRDARESAKGRKDG